MKPKDRLPTEQGEAIPETEVPSATQNKATQVVKPNGRVPMAQGEWSTETDACSAANKAIDAPKP